MAVDRRYEQMVDNANYSTPPIRNPRTIRCMVFDPALPVHRRPAHNRRPDVPAAVDGRLTWEGAVDLFRFAKTRSRNTQENIRHNLLNTRLTRLLAARGRRGVAEVLPEDLVDYLTAYRQVHGGAHATAEKIHRQLRHFAVWLREQQGIDSLDRPPLTSFTVPALLESSPPSKDDEEEEPALSRAEVDRLLHAALQPPGRRRQEGTEARDALIVKLLVYTGVRPAELVNLDVRSVLLEARPPQILIRGVIHHRSRRRITVKTQAAEREVPLTMSRASGLVGDLRTYLTSERPRDAGGTSLFCSIKRGPDKRRLPLTVDALQAILERLERATGIHCNAYRFRHTCATWLVDAGMHEQYLMQIMGWDDSSMVSRYFRGNRNPAILEAAAGIMA